MAAARQKLMNASATLLTTSTFIFRALGQVGELGHVHLRRRGRRHPGVGGRLVILLGLQRSDATARPPRRQPGPPPIVGERDLYRQ